jgi:ABC-type nitrate/sulfonate/bicarbonate transport system substrate-binding protein
MILLTRARSLAALAAGAALAARPARAATAIAVGQIGNSIAFFPLFVAQNEGFFRDAGLDVNLTRFASGTLVGTAMTSGSVDVGCGVITDVFQLLHAGRAAKVIGSLVDGYYVDVIVSKQFLEATKVSRTSRLSDRIGALRGKKLGITAPGSGTEALLVYLLRSRNLDPTRDVELVNMGTDQAAIVAALRTGRIDGVSFAWPLSMIVEAQNVGKALIVPALGDVPAMRGQVQGVIYARPDVIGRRDADLVGFIRAIGRAEALIRQDPTRMRAALRQYDPNMNDPSIDALFAAYLPVIPNQARINVAGYERAVAFHRQVGMIAAGGDAYGDVVASGIVDRALRG